MTANKAGLMIFFLLGALLWTAPVGPEPRWTLAAAAEPPPSEAAENLRAVLAPRALRLADADGSVALEIWLRQGIPVQATPEQVENGLTWAEFTPSTVLGLLRLHAPLRDYRNQEVPIGVYTLR